MDAERRRQAHAWMVRFADGDRAAFQPLFDALWPVLLAFTSRALAPPADAEDAAQQAMVKIFARIADFDRTRDGVSWALGIAGYEALTVRKQRARRCEIGADALEGTAPPPDGRAPAESDVEGRLIAADLQHAVRELVGELPARDRAALACAFTGESPPTDERARKRRFRAIERLRAAWRRAHG